jgi:hypothetical protein
MSNMTRDWTVVDVVENNDDVDDDDDDEYDDDDDDSIVDSVEIADDDDSNDVVVAVVVVVVFISSVVPTMVRCLCGGDDAIMNASDTTTVPDGRNRHVLVRLVLPNRSKTRIAPEVRTSYMFRLIVMAVTTTKRLLCVDSSWFFVSNCVVNFSFFLFVCVFLIDMHAWMHQSINLFVGSICSCFFLLGICFFP